MEKLLRHRQTKGPVSARLYLNCRTTPRLYPTTVNEPHAVIRDLQSPTPQRPRPARVPALNNVRPHTGPEVGSARELLRPSIHPSHGARSLGDCTDLHSRTWDQTRRSGSDRTALVCARLRHQRSQQHQFLAGSVAFFDIILVREPTRPAGDGVPDRSGS